MEHDDTVHRFQKLWWISKYWDIGLLSLVPLGGDINITADDGSSILFEAAGGGNPDCIALLLEYGGSGNLPNKAGHLPIHKAAYEGHYLWVCSFYISSSNNFT